MLTLPRSELAVIMSDDPHFLLVSLLRSVIGVALHPACMKYDHPKQYPPVPCLALSRMTFHTAEQKVIILLPGLIFDQESFTVLAHNHPGKGLSHSLLRHFLVSALQARLFWGRYVLHFVRGHTVGVVACNKLVPFCLEIKLGGLLQPHLAINSSVFLKAARLVLGGSLFLDSHPTGLVLYERPIAASLLSGIELTSDTSTYNLPQPHKIGLPTPLCPEALGTWYSVIRGCEPVLFITQGRAYLHHIPLLDHLPGIYREMAQDEARSLTHIQITVDIKEGCDLASIDFGSLVQAAIQLLHDLSELDFKLWGLVLTSSPPCRPYLFFSGTMAWLGCMDGLHHPRVHFPHVMACTQILQHPENVASQHLVHRSELHQLTLLLHILTTHMLLRLAFHDSDDQYQACIQAISFVLHDEPGSRRHIVRITKGHIFASIINPLPIVPEGMHVWADLVNKPVLLANWLCDISHLTINYVITILDEKGVVLDLLERMKVATWSDLLLPGHNEVDVYESFVGDIVKVLRQGTGFRDFTCLSVVMLQLMRRDGYFGIERTVRIAAHPAQPTQPPSPVYPIEYFLNDVSSLF